ncbi:MAG: electron transfer flavoprotein subunit alpha/FixB family protein [Bdellovibrionota bacterium]
MSSIFVYVESKQQKLSSSSKELLAKASVLAKQAELELHAISIGHNHSSIAEELKSFGVKTYYLSDHEQNLPIEGQAYAELIASICSKANPLAVLATASAFAKTIFPRVAQLLSAGIVTDCVELSWDANHKLQAQKPLYSGKCVATATIHTNCAIAVCRPNSFLEKGGEGLSLCDTKVETVEAVSRHVGARLIEEKEVTASKVQLAEAEIVVSGGRSLKSGENFSILEDLAQVLGAAVGASRAAVDAGYVPHSMQVGQTGKTVNPSLYIACGISGAIQHLAGMRTSKTIVAINTDPEAPIFQHCDYGIVGDLFDVVPVMTQSLKKILHQ